MKRKPTGQLNKDLDANLKAVKSSLGKVKDSYFTLRALPRNVTYKGNKPSAFIEQNDDYPPELVPLLVKILYLRFARDCLEIVKDGRTLHGKSVEQQIIERKDIFINNLKKFEKYKNINVLNNDDLWNQFLKFLPSAQQEPLNKELQKFKLPFISLEAPDPKVMREQLEFVVDKTINQLEGLGKNPDKMLENNRLLQLLLFKTLQLELIHKVGNQQQKNDVLTRRMSDAELSSIQADPKIMKQFDIPFNGITHFAGRDLDDIRGNYIRLRKPFDDQLRSQQEKKQKQLEQQQQLQKNPEPQGEVQRDTSEASYGQMPKLNKEIAQKIRKQRQLSNELKSHYAYFNPDTLLSGVGEPLGSKDKTVNPYGVIPASLIDTEMDNSKDSLGLRADEFARRKIEEEQSKTQPTKEKSSGIVEDEYFQEIDIGEAKLLVKQTIKSLDKSCRRKGLLGLNGEKFLLKLRRLSLDTNELLDKPHYFFRFCEEINKIVAEINSDKWENDIGTKAAEHLVGAKETLLNERNRNRQLRVEGIIQEYFDIESDLDKPMQPVIPKVSGLQQVDSNKQTDSAAEPDASEVNKFIQEQDRLAKEKQEETIAQEQQIDRMNQNKTNVLHPITREESDQVTQKTNKSISLSTLPDDVAEEEENQRRAKEIADREARAKAEREAKEREEREAKDLAEKVAKEKAERDEQELAAKKLAVGINAKNLERIAGHLTFDPDVPLKKKTLKDAPKDLEPLAEEVFAPTPPLILSQPKPITQLAKNYRTAHPLKGEFKLAIEEAVASGDLTRAAQVDPEMEDNIEVSRYNCNKPGLVDPENYVTYKRDRSVVPNKITFEIGKNFKGVIEPQDLGLDEATGKRVYSKGFEVVAEGKYHDLAVNYDPGKDIEHGDVDIETVGINIAAKVGPPTFEVKVRNITKLEPTISL